MTLLNLDFYNESMRPIFAEWAYLWLQKQHIHGIDKQEALRYMLEGASARSDLTAKVTAIDVAITERKIDVGDMSPLPVPTLAYQRSLSDEGRKELAQVREAARQKAHDRAAQDDPGHMAFVETEIHHLEIAKEIGVKQRDLVRLSLLFVIISGLLCSLRR